MNIDDYLKENNIPKELIIEISKVFKPKTLKKNEYFVKYNQKMDKIAILINGILVSRYTSEKGKEITSKFYSTNGDKIVVDYLSFINETNSTEEIQVVEDSSLLIISIEDYKSIVKKFPAINTYIRSFAEESYLKGLERIREFQLLNAQERVEKFTKTHSNILNSLMIKDKSSYLGLSRNVYTNSLKKIEFCTI